MGIKSETVGVGGGGGGGRRHRRRSNCDRVDGGGM